MQYLDIIPTMKRILMTILTLLLLFGCSKKVEPSLEDTQDAPLIYTTLESDMRTKVVEDDFSSLSAWNQENYEEILALFQQSCRSSKVLKIYKDLCTKAASQESAKEFLQEEFTPYKIYTAQEKHDGLLTGYYEPFLRGSFEKDETFRYPIYRKPNDMITVDLSAVYPELKNYRLRGRVVGDKLIPYYSRQESNERGLDADILCYTDSQLDRFFLEIQGSGRVFFDDNSSMYVGFENQNGHKYRAIGRYLVKIGALRLEDVSLQSIREWLSANPSRIDEVLNYNQSMVFFQKREQGATGSLGFELTPKRSVAVDRRYIPLGSMLYMESQIKDESLSQVVFAQDTGGAIKGPIRADLFLGSGEEALDVAGHLKSPLRLWILLPKKRMDKDI